MLLYTLGGLSLSLAIAVTTLTLARQNLVADRENRAFSVVVRNGERVEGRLADETEIDDVSSIFDSLTITDRSFPLIRLGDEWSASNPQVFDADGVPDELITAVGANRAGRMRVRLDDKSAIVTGLPIPDIDAAYYEAALTDDVEVALRTLGIILLAVSGASTVLSAALGSWASRRALSPLADVRFAAESLAAGELQTRLDPPADTDLASLADSFNHMAQSLEDRIERDSRFASEVSHELRSPLMTLNASIEVLNNSRRDLTPRNQTALYLLTGEISRFTILVENLLEISRYDVGTASLQAEPIDLVEFVRQSVRHNANSEVQVDVGDLDHCVIIGDKRRLAQVLTNLFDNAAKYGAGVIRVSVRAINETAQLTVEDEGPGVPLVERHVIFDRFSRGSASSRRGHSTGSGLGLSLVTEHVGLHGGSVHVTDRADGGSGACFTVDLPIGNALAGHDPL